MHVGVLLKKIKHRAFIGTSFEFTMKEITACDVTAENGGGGGNRARSSGSHLLVRREMQVTMLFVGFGLLWMLLYNSTNLFGSPSFSHYFNDDESPKGNHDPTLESVLKSASMEDKTVIITTLNDAWAEPGSIFDLFLESFRLGNETLKLLNHLVVITWDQKAHARCLALHKHCHQLISDDHNFTGEAFYMTPNYLNMMWKRTEFLGSILQMGFNFLFTDTDIMWLRDPFKEFYQDADFQIACDYFNGDSNDLNNWPNGGFKFVRSNTRTIWFYKFWVNSGNVYPKLNEQDVLNNIKMNPLISDIKLKIRFLSTSYFGGFCQASQDFNKVSTMHANCCVGLENKVNDLKILLWDWKKYMALSESEKKQPNFSWSVPQNCSTSFERAKQRKEN